EGAWVPNAAEECVETHVVEEWKPAHHDVALGRSEPPLEIRSVAHDVAMRDHRALWPSGAARCELDQRDVGGTDGDRGKPRVGLWNIALRVAEATSRGWRRPPQHPASGSWATSSRAAARAAISNSRLA